MTDFGNVTTRAEEQADLTVTFHTYSMTDRSDYMEVALCSPDAVILPTEGEDFDWVWDERCSFPITYSDLGSACTVSNLGITDKYPCPPGEGIWEPDPICPSNDTVYSSYNEYDMWEAWIDVGPQSINGTWTLWTCTNWDGGEATIGSISGVTIDVCTTPE